MTICFKCNNVIIEEECAKFDEGLAHINGCPTVLETLLRQAHFTIEVAQGLSDPALNDACDALFYALSHYENRAL